MIDRMLYCAKQLIVSLELGQEENIQQWLNEFKSSVIDAWAKFQDDKIKVTINQLPKVMYMFATEDLPKEIKNKHNREKLLKQLKLFVNTIEIILNPEEQEIEQDEKKSLN